MESTTGQMRDFSEFCEQLQEIRLKFHKWDSCERTVALYYLMAGLPYANAKFLLHTLEQCIAAANTPESQVLERNANNSVFITRLMTENPQNALNILLTHLPLLKPGNKETACCYLMTIRRVLAEFIAPPYKIYNDCVEIMSYVFIHPAFDKEDKKTFRHLLKHILSQVGPDNFVHSPVNESSDESSSPNPETAATIDQQSQSISTTRPNRHGRSNSLTPATQTTSSHESLNIWSSSSQENLAHHQQKPRSYSLSNDKSSLLLNLSNLQSSSSETRLQDLQLLSNLPVMKSILSWLKSLRLHKYSWVFHNLTYTEMLELTDERLQTMGITKGARHKLLLSISKLKERSCMLTELETEVMNGGDLNAALKKLKGVLQSPLQVTTGEDLPSQFVKVMGKVCTQLLMLRQPSDECLVLFSTLCDRADSLDGFTDEQKRRLNMWKGQLSEGTHVPVYPQKVPSSNSRSAWHCKLPAFSQDTHAQKSSSYPNVQNSKTVNPHRHSVGSVTLKKDLYPVMARNMLDVFPKSWKESATVSAAAAAAAAAVNTNSTSTTGNSGLIGTPGTSGSAGGGGGSGAPSAIPTDLLITNKTNTNCSNNQFHVRFQDSTENTKLISNCTTTTTTTMLPNLTDEMTKRQILKNIDIENSLESLCLQMMEHALGP